MYIPFLNILYRLPSQWQLYILLRLIKNICLPMYLLTRGKYMFFKDYPTYYCLISNKQIKWRRRSSFSPRNVFKFKFCAAVKACLRQVALSIKPSAPDVEFKPTDVFKSGRQTCYHYSITWTILALLFLQFSRLKHHTKRH